MFNNSYVFSERYDSAEDYFTAEPRLVGERRLKANLVPDVRAVATEKSPWQGEGFSNMHFDLGNNTIECHVALFEVGNYKWAHRHGPGSHVLILDGVGYSLMWPESEEHMNIPWTKGALLVPPRGWFHQHFNIGPYPGRYLALRTGSDRSGVKYRLGLSFSKGGDLLPYEEEAPEIRAEFLRELARNGVESILSGDITP